jgi:hypothetical protein
VTAIATSCGSDDDHTTSLQSTGTVRLNLATVSPSGIVYRLVNAEFEVEGPENATLVGPRNAPDIVERLAVGSYTVTLQDGWRLQFEWGDGTWRNVDATLKHSATVNFEIEERETTHVVYEFRVDGEDVRFGEIEITISVDDGAGGVNGSSGAGGAAGPAAGAGGAAGGGGDRPSGGAGGVTCDGWTAPEHLGSSPLYGAVVKLASAGDEAVVGWLRCEEEGVAQLASQRFSGGSWSGVSMLSGSGHVEGHDSEVPLRNFQLSMLPDGRAAATTFFSFFTQPWRRPARVAP